MNLIPELQQVSLEEEFQRLLQNWREETALFSSSTRIIEHPTYQRIIALGPTVLPLLLRELERTSDGHLSTALTALTGAQPVPQEDQGRIRKIADAWLHWARENDLSW